MISDTILERCEKMDERYSNFFRNLYNLPFFMQEQNHVFVDPFFSICNQPDTSESISIIFNCIGSVYNYDTCDMYFHINEKAENTLSQAIQHIDILWECWEKFCQDHPEYKLGTRPADYFADPKLMEQTLTSIDDIVF